MSTDPITPADTVLNDLARTLTTLRSQAETSALSKAKQAAYLQALDDIASAMDLTMTKEYKA